MPSSPVELLPARSAGDLAGRSSVGEVRFFEEKMKMNNTEGQENLKRKEREKNKADNILAKRIHFSFMFLRFFRRKKQETRRQLTTVRIKKKQIKKRKQNKCPVRQWNFYRQDLPPISPVEVPLARCAFSKKNENEQHRGTRKYLKNEQEQNKSENATFVFAKWRHFLSFFTFFFCEKKKETRRKIIT